MGIKDFILNGGLIGKLRGFDHEKEGHAYGFKELGEDLAISKSDSQEPNIIKRTVDRGKERIKSVLDPLIEQQVEIILDRLYYRRLVDSLINLLIYIAAIFLSLFPIFGHVFSRILSSILLLGSLIFALYRIIRFIRGKHTIPLIKSIIRERDIKRGISAYIRKLDIKIVAVSESIIDRFLRLAGDPVNKRFLDRFIDHCWNLVKKSIIRFALLSASLIAFFFVLRHALLASVSDLNFFEIAFYPFYALWLSL